MSFSDFNKMSTFKSSGYRSWSSRPFDVSAPSQQELTYRSLVPSHGTVTSQSHDIVTRSHDTHLRLHLVTNSKGMVQLDLRNRRLLSIPVELFLFSRIEVLKLSENFLDELPLAISRLRSLKFLYLEKNELQFLPETINNCTHLVEINLTKNRLSALPTKIGMLRNLRVLRIGQNDFECLPHEIGQLDNLHYLDVHSNRLWYLPFSIGKLNKLKYLNLSNNRFEHLPLPVCKIVALQTLTLRGNNLMNLLPDFDNLRNLLELNLAYNKFEVIPQSIFRLKTLLYLNLGGNQLQNIPPALTGLKSLKVLHAQNNKLEFIPDMFTNLQYLNVSSNKLYNFSVANMKHMKSLNANNNHLENIPMGLYSMPRLQSLRLNTNQIRYISPDIAGLRKLRTLDIGNNQLVNIPQVLQQLDRLDYFNVKGNQITDKITLHNGEIQTQPDFHKRKRIYQNNNKRNSHDPHRRYHTHKGHRSRSQDSVTMSRSYTLPLTHDNAHKMWDSEDLLQNGFSQRHLVTNSSSAYLNSKERIRPHSHQGQSSRNSKHRHGNSYPGDSQSISTYHRINAHKAALMTDNDETDDALSADTPLKTTDYQLLGICNQVEMLMNKQLLHPVLSLKGHDMGKSFSEKAIIKTESGLWRISDDKNDNVPPGLVATTTETFTVTPQGGWLSSSHDSNISIFLPPKAVSTLTQTQMKILNIEPDKMLELRHENRLISNILSLGPIVYLKNLDDTDFNHQVTITIPAPTGDRRGHLHLLTIRDDNSCIPSSSGYKHKNGYVVLRAWNLAGKAAVLTRAKCKYKASKSMEQLLTELAVATSNNKVSKPQ